MRDYCCNTKSPFFLFFFFLPREETTRVKSDLAIKPCFEWANNKVACASRPQAVFITPPERYQELSPYSGQDIIADLARGIILPDGL